MSAVQFGLTGPWVVAATSTSAHPDQINYAHDGVFGAVLAIGVDGDGGLEAALGQPSEAGLERDTLAQVGLVGHDVDAARACHVTGAIGRAVVDDQQGAFGVEEAQVVEHLFQASTGLIGRNQVGALHGRRVPSLASSSCPRSTPTKSSQLAEAAKAELRKRMRALRTAHPAEALKIRDRALVARALALPAFTAARSVALFFPMAERKEIDLRELDAAARQQGKGVCYPFLERRGDALVSGLRLSASLADLAERGQRFNEPPPDAPEAQRGDVDLLFVPALAVAPSGHRLGYGAGFYDSLVPDICPPSQAVAVAYDFQLLVDLPTLPHDVPCDFILTDARTLIAHRG